MTSDTVATVLLQPYQGTHLCYRRYFFFWLCQCARMHTRTRPHTHEHTPQHTLTLVSGRPHAALNPALCCRLHLSITSSSRSPSEHAPRATFAIPPTSASSTRTSSSSTGNGPHQQALNTTLNAMHLCWYVRPCAIQLTSWQPPRRRPVWSMCLITVARGGAAAAATRARPAAFTAITRGR